MDMDSPPRQGRASSCCSRPRDSRKRRCRRRPDGGLLQPEWPAVEFSSSSDFRGVSSSDSSRRERRRRRRRPHAGFLIALMAASLSVASSGDDAYAQGNGNNNNGQGSSSSSSSSSSSYSQGGSPSSTSKNKTSSKNAANKGWLQVQDFCRRSYIQVISLQLLCDTPGAYYYGSSAYRNSEVCVSGDKAHLAFQFRIPTSVNEETIYLQVDFGLFDQYQVVDFANLCKMQLQRIGDASGTYYYIEHTDDKYGNRFLGNADDAVQQDGAYGQNDYYQDDGAVVDDDYSRGDVSVCPYPGTYVLTATYAVPSNADSTLHYTPDIRLTFLDEFGRRVGCSTTGPVAQRLANSRRAAAGMWALGVSCVVILALFGGLLYMSHRRKQRLQDLRQKGDAAAMDTSRYQYFRTLPNGQVIPLPGQHQRRLPPQSHEPSDTLHKPEPSGQLPQGTIILQQQVMVGDDEDEDDSSSEEAVNMSNPEYNETELPTRPII